MSASDNLPNCNNLAFVEGLYEAFLKDRNAVPEDWRQFFDEQENGDGARNGNGNGNGLRPSFRPASLFDPPAAVGNSSGNGGSAAVDEGEAAKVALLQDRVNQLIRNYRLRGHRIAKIDPLDRPRMVPPELEMDYFHFSEEDYARKVHCSTLQCEGDLTIDEILDHLRNTYCRSIGVQYMHIGDIQVRRWLQRRMEGTENRLELGRAEQRRILTRLIDAVTFEEFLHKKFIGAKSFSLDGCESLIPLLDLAIEHAGQQGTKEIVLGMAHRGRLNVLANIMGKCPREIFREFADADPDLYEGRGDVKYHLGYSHDWKTNAGDDVHLSLCFNPSHLEFVNSVAMGRVRAKQDRVDDTFQERCMCLLIHGDAAFPGEGIIQETLNMSQLAGYSVGGTLHVIVNNQIGFTTSPKEHRSSIYATDVAKMLHIPIFHVNGEDPEAVAQVVRIAMDFRKAFKRDVVIDMYGYRRLGHNETDEPTFTQPMLYRAIRKRKTVLEGYLDHLLRLKGITREEADQLTEERRDKLEAHLAEARSETYQRPLEKTRGIWSRSSFEGGEDQDSPASGVEKAIAVKTLDALTRWPEDFTPHPKIVKLLEARRDMAKGERPLDWAAAEALALATCALDGYRVRLSGQDCRRGTFSHRHAVLYDYEDGLTYIPLAEFSADQKPVEIYNSPLTETGVLGFDYGYSLEYPDGLTVWEAQFGDFANVAQVIFDQFISSAEDKWNRLSGLVTLLPHGFEGMGPEHSSARLERYLDLAAEDNMRICNPTTPAQYFHMLRRQVVSPVRKPLIVMSPKSLLRHPKVVSSLEEIESGTFQPLLRDERSLDKRGVKRLLLCSGKIYYELEKLREETRREDVAILRLEQLYPLREATLTSALSDYPAGVPVIWTQEEPENMGAWRYLRARFGCDLFGEHPLICVSRPESASPATGSANSHKREQRKVLEAAFGIG